MTSWFLDIAHGSWFKDVYSSATYEPVAITIFDGDDPTDRVLLIGGDDGYIRSFGSNEAEDDGTAFESSMILGPLASLGGAYSPAVLSEVRPQLDTDSTDILYEVLAGDTPELALASEAVTFAGDGSFAAGERVTENPRVGGRYLYVKVGTAAANSQWSLEALRTRLSYPTSSRGRFRSAD
jgi:hypothetical protein